MSRRWTPNLHPRDKNGKFRGKGGSQRTRVARVMKVNRAVSGAIVASTSLHAVAAAQGAGTHYAAGRPTLAVVSAGIAAVSGAQALNSAHFIKKSGTDRFKTKSVKEQSKFARNYGARTAALGVANSGLVDVYNSLTAGINQGKMDPLVRKVANKQGMNRVYDHYGQRANTGGLKSGIQVARANRHGVYNISDVKGKRVA